MNTQKMLKLAVVGAVSAVVIDYFFHPTLMKSVGLK